MGDEQRGLLDNDRVGARVGRRARGWRINHVPGDATRLARPRQPPDGSAVDRVHPVGSRLPRSVAGPPPGGYGGREVHERAAPSCGEFPGGLVIDIDVRAVPADSTPGDGPPVEMTVIVAGEVDTAASARLRDLLSALRTTRTPLVVDVARARSHGPRMLRVLCDVRARRQDDGLPFRLHGLHADNVPAPGELGLADLFVVYDEARRAAGAPPAALPHPAAPPD